jgi:hypothetical protein
MKLVNLAQTAEESQADTLLGESDDAGPKYPYGLSLYLNEDTMAKLGITELPPVGQALQLTAMVKVTGTSSREENQKDGSVEICKCVDLQITDMALQGEGDKGKSTADVLYGS